MKKYNLLAEVLKAYTTSTLPLASEPVLETEDFGGKSSKQVANYTNHPVNGNQCSECTMFEKPSSCSAVEGTISEEGHCKYFEASNA